jgi:hypothetical protein
MFLGKFVLKPVRRFPVRANETRTGAIGFHYSEFPLSLATSLRISVAR